ncbi:MAG TPA: hypothetical protein VNA32_09300 [Actinomycetota bacterium]|nr:hypothetical protein [Actinomycetota bacterium]
MRIIDREHDRLIEHIHVHVDPEAPWATFSRQMGDRLGDCRVNTESPDKAAIHSHEIERQGLAPVAHLRSCVSVGEDDHVIVTNERPTTLDIGDDFGSSACREGQVARRCGAIDRVRLRLVEVRMSVDVENPVSTAALESQHGTQED